ARHLGRGAPNGGIGRWNLDGSPPNWGRRVPGFPLSAGLSCALRTLATHTRYRYAPAGLGNPGRVQLHSVGMPPAGFCLQQPRFPRPDPLARFPTTAFQVGPDSPVATFQVALDGMTAAFGPERPLTEPTEEAMLAAIAKLKAEGYAPAFVAKLVTIA